ncbi:hypothetical protein EYF80_038970 [Liparis tanakae]|uniref:Uncharacterized protein n=1 Tax=Liparis tanakae TaxID=230148 RepID=A0A4Z2GD38_9TELE|nr:hypothetical protein EYF80_038970 [Liparis tanakae]
MDASSQFNTGPGAEEDSVASAAQSRGPDSSSAGHSGAGSSTSAMAAPRVKRRVERQPGSAHCGGALPALGPISFSQDCFIQKLTMHQ